MSEIKPIEQEKEKARDHYLKNFQRENMPLDFFGRPNIDEIGIKILDLLKKEDLTHDQAYASLQYVYNLIKYESNFLKLS
ncbi:hypothetical protein VNN37_00680 [Lactococcus garvieae]|uniref:hypothetical protein n=1 Tax=Lactococcus garvieae TaxID=1363 RepID=UPI0030CAF7F9